MLTIGIHHLGEIASIDLRGKFIKGQGGHQLQMLAEKVLSAGSHQILLNLQEVPIIDSMGIGEIVRCYNKVRDAGGELKLVGLTDRVYGAMSITQLLKVIATFPTEEEAAESFTKEKKTKGKKRKGAEAEAEAKAE